MDTVIDVVGLVKMFGRTPALAEFSLNVAKEEAHGFLGPNGSGHRQQSRVLSGLPRQVTPDPPR